MYASLGRRVARCGSAAGPWADASARSRWPKACQPGPGADQLPPPPTRKARPVASRAFPALRVPCLFVSGTRDAFGSPAELEAATAAIPGPVTHRVEGQGPRDAGGDAEVAALVAGDQRRSRHRLTQGERSSGLRSSSSRPAVSGVGAHDQHHQDDGAGGQDGEGRRQGPESRGHSRSPPGRRRRPPRRQRQ